jgi:S1-C subfamily serine protease
VALDVIRYGDRRRVEVRLSEAPATALEAPVAQAPRAAAGASKLGLGVQPISPELVRQYDLGGPAEGLVVTDVERMSVAARNGVGEGTRIVAVDGQAVRDVEGFRRLVERKGPGQVISLRIRFRTGEGSIINIRLPD